MRARIIFWANLLVGLALLVYVLFRFGVPALEMLGQGASWLWIGAFVATVAASVLCLSWRWGFILAGLVPPPSLVTLTLHRSAGHSLAVLVPSGKLGGDPLRAYLATRVGLGPGNAIASVAIDRTLEMGATAPFSVLFATVLLQQGIPDLERVIVTVLVGTVGLALGVGVAVHRLRHESGLVTALVRSAGLDRFEVVDAQMDVMHTAEAAAAQLVGQTSRMAWAFVVGLVSNGIVIAEFTLLLAAFDLPVTPITVVAAIFATAAAHMAPIPAGVGILEGAQVWLFSLLGYPADVGLAVGLAVRLRELLWMLPGVVYMLVHSLGASRRGVREA